MGRHHPADSHMLQMRSDGSRSWADYPDASFKLWHERVRRIRKPWSKPARGGEVKPRIRTTTFAKVQVTLEVPVGSWGPECGLDQVYRQASEEALGKLRRITQLDRIRIVGVTKITAVSTEVES